MLFRQADKYGTVLVCVCVLGLCVCVCVCVCVGVGLLALSPMYAVCLYSRVCGH